MGIFFGIGEQNMIYMVFKLKASEKKFNFILDWAMAESCHESFTMQVV